MSSLVKGIQHINLRTEGMDMFEKTVDFYTRVLELPVYRSWGTAPKCTVMVDTGSGYVEIQNSADLVYGTAAVNHFALATDEVDKLIEIVRAEGYEVTVEPREVMLGDNPPYPVRIAFFRGPCNEIIELFKEL
jgi:glyoxylase I family protein